MILITLLSTLHAVVEHKNMLAITGSWKEELLSLEIRNTGRSDRYLVNYQPNFISLDFGNNGRIERVDPPLGDVIEPGERDVVVLHQDQSIIMRFKSESHYHYAVLRYRVGVLPRDMMAVQDHESPLIPLAIKNRERLTFSKAVPSFEISLDYGQTKTLNIDG